MTLFSKRLPHVVTRKDLAVLLAPTYAAAQRVDDEEAHERLSRAIADPVLLDLFYESLSAGLDAKKGRRTQADALMDRLSAGIQERRGRVRPAPETPGLAAVLVRIDLSLGLASPPMRDLLETEKGRAALEEGWRELGTHLVRELLKKSPGASRD